MKDLHFLFLLKISSKFNKNRIRLMSYKILKILYAAKLRKFGIILINQVIIKVHLKNINNSYLN